jgi:tetratricopeptide (TPR) repeat protein
MDKAISLNPHDIWVISNACVIKAYLGDYDAAVEWISKAALIDPFMPDNLRENFFDTHFIGGQYELALEQFVGWQNPIPHNYLGKAAALALLGRIDEAREAVQEYERNRPEGWDRAEILRAYARMCAKPEDGERWLEGFRKAGINI